MLDVDHVRDDKSCLAAATMFRHPLTSTQRAFEELESAFGAVAVNGPPPTASITKDTKSCSGSAAGTRDSIMVAVDPVTSLTWYRAWMQVLLQTAVWPDMNLKTDDSRSAAARARDCSTSAGSSRGGLSESVHSFTHGRMNHPWRHTQEFSNCTQGRPHSMPTSVISRISRVAQVVH